MSRTVITRAAPSVLQIETVSEKHIDYFISYSVGLVSQPEYSPHATAGYFDHVPRTFMYQPPIASAVREVNQIA